MAGCGPPASLMLDLPLALCLAGPTGAGKTELAIKLAEVFDCEIINADSRQVYQDFPVITAQPDQAAQAAIPHHLYGFLTLNRRMDAGLWRKMALEHCLAIHRRGKLPLFVGGTGFYFRSIMGGLAEIPAVAPAIARHFAERMRADGPQALHEELRMSDPEYASKIHPNDRQRIARALEVYGATGRPFSWWHRHSPAKPLVRGLLLMTEAGLDELVPRLKARIGAMLEKGALGEVQRALERYPAGDYPGWKSIGCKELKRHLEHELTLPECQAAWLANTRAYAKRQLTWFRTQSEAHYIEAPYFDAARAAVSQWLDAERQHP